MKILLLGRSGQLAWELQRSLACLGEVIAVDRNTSPVAMDLADPMSVRDAVRAVRPHLAVNAAAYTQVDKAEEEADLARRINAAGPGTLAEALAEIGAGLIHYSSDYVFSGDAEVPYLETAATAPRSVYGWSKLKGEEAVAAMGLPHFILRTAWVYGMRGRNFLRTMLHLMAQRDVVSVVDDQRGAPTWCREIAECTALMIVQCRVGGRFQPKERSGIYHMTSGGGTSWFGFAAKIREIARGHGLLSENSAVLRPVTSEEFAARARRPAYSILSNDKMRRRFNLALSPWETALNYCLADYASLSRPRNG